MVKKLVLVGFAAIIVPGSTMQLVMGILVSLSYLLLVGVARTWQLRGGRHLRAALLQC